MNLLKLSALLGLIALSPWAVSKTAPDTQGPSAQKLVEQANLAAFYPGADGRAEARMTITDNQGRRQRRQFVLLRRDIADGGDQQLLVFFSRPSDVRGTVYRVEKNVGGDDDRWLYLPSLDLIKRIAAGDKRTAFVGSHFFYEDVSGRNIALDRYRLLESTDQQYLIEGTPRDPGSVEFSRYRVWLDRHTRLPLKVEYYDADDRLYRRVEALETATIQGYPSVVKSRISDLVQGGNTLLEFRGIRYDIGLPSALFSERSLRNPPNRWLK